MHELSIVVEILKTVEETVRENKLTEVEAIVLQVGELSTVVPRYLEECFPAAADGTMFETTELRIEVLPANAICGDCNKVYPVVPNKGCCPFCRSERKEILSGREFYLKEIVAR